MRLDPVYSLFTVHIVALLLTIVQSLIHVNEFLVVPLSEGSDEPEVAGIERMIVNPLVSFTGNGNPTLHPTEQFAAATGPMMYLGATQLWDDGATWIELKELIAQIEILPHAGAPLEADTADWFTSLFHFLSA